MNFRPNETVFSFFLKVNSTWGIPLCIHTNTHRQTQTDGHQHTRTRTHTLGSGSHGCRQRLCECFLMSYLAYLPENYCRGPFTHLFAQDDRLISYLCSIQNICFSMVRSGELNIYSAWKQRRLSPPAVFAGCFVLSRVLALFWMLR